MSIKQGLKWFGAKLVKSPFSTGQKKMKIGEEKALVSWLLAILNKSSHSIGEVQKFCDNFKKIKKIMKNRGVSLKKLGIDKTFITVGDFSVMTLDQVDILRHMLSSLKTQLDRMEESKNLKEIESLKTQLQNERAERKKLEKQMEEGFGSVLENLNRMSTQLSDISREVLNSRHANTAQFTGQTSELSAQNNKIIATINHHGKILQQSVKVLNTHTRAMKEVPMHISAIDNTLELIAAGNNGVKKDLGEVQETVKLVSRKVDGHDVAFRVISQTIPAIVPHLTEEEDQGKVAQVG